ncbi:unnamed protein product [Leptidea sinapis]|uniref:Uncharacterized protein n=1 Tax=Leptidea sinapis TaxID=189913 RepID=A0A5E4PWA6_9NEOP|nr:unnamed protein product [Leptidea sinapis]
MYRLYMITYLASVLALPNPELPIAETFEAARTLAKDCTNGIFSAKCLKIEAISLLEKLNSKDELQLLPGISVVKEDMENNSKANEFAAELARALPSKPDERLDKYLLYRLGTYLDSHSVKLRLLDDGASEEARALMNEGRGKGGLGGVIGIKSLSSGGKSTTYEIVSKPVYTHSHSHSTAHEDVGGYGHSGYGRSV